MSEQQVTPEAALQALATVAKEFKGTFTEHQYLIDCIGVLGKIVTPPKEEKEKEN